VKVPLLSPGSSKPAPHLYFVNTPVDALLIGGLSIVAFLAMGALQRVHGQQLQWMGAVAALTWLCNWPHFAATSYRLYHSQENIAQYPLTALLIPVVMVAAIISSLAAPYTIAPYFVKLYLIWSPYHYSGQSVGISLIYARRAGFPFGRLERLALSGFIFGTFIAQTVRSEVGVSRQAFYGVTYPSIGLPPWTATVATTAMIVSGVVFLVLVLRWCVMTRRMLPPIVFLPAVTQFVWFVLGWRVPSFYSFVPFFHGLQYLLIAWAMQLSETMAQHGIKPSTSFVGGESLRWGIGILLGGTALFWLLPHVVATAGFDYNLAYPVVIAAVQVHHFFVDGVIWKLRNPGVGGPMLVNVEDLVRRPRAAVAAA